MNCEITTRGAKILPLTNEIKNTEKNQWLTYIHTKDFHKSYTIVHTKHCTGEENSMQEGSVIY